MHRRPSGGGFGGSDGGGGASGGAGDNGGGSDGDGGGCGEAGQKLQPLHAHHEQKKIVCSALHHHSHDSYGKSPVE